MKYVFKGIDRLCICGRAMERRGDFLSCASCNYVYKDHGDGRPVALVRIAGEKLTPPEVGAEWFAKIRAAL